MNPLFIPVGIELGLVLLLIILLFGAAKIPELGRSIGQSLGAFKLGRKETEDSVDE